MSLPCKFFNSPRGCRDGDACTFLHGQDRGDFRPPKRPRAEEDRYPPPRPPPRERMGRPDRGPPAVAPGEVYANPPQGGVSSSSGSRPGELHPCLRVYQQCVFPGCRFADEPYDACLLCLKRKEHVVCDLGLENPSDRKKVEREYVESGTTHTKHCREWLQSNCRFNDCRFLHFLVSPGYKATARAARDEQPVAEPMYAAPARGRPQPQEPLHPCVRIYGVCDRGESCKFATAPRSACLLCLKGKPHDRCDANRESVQGRAPPVLLAEPVPLAKQVLEQRILQLEAEELDLKEQELLRQERELDLIQRRLEIERREKALQLAMKDVTREEPRHSASRGPPQEPMRRSEPQAPSAYVPRQGYSGKGGNDRPYRSRGAM